jgi:hypothetical protein
MTDCMQSLGGVYQMRYQNHEAEGSLSQSQMFYNAINLEIHMEKRIPYDLLMGFGR